MHPLSGFSHVIWLSENVTVLILVSAALLSVALDCLTGQINSLYPVLTNADFFFFPLCYRESKCSTFSLSLFLSLL